MFTSNFRKIGTVLIQIYQRITTSWWQSLILFSCLLLLLELLIYISYCIRDGYWLNKFGAYAHLHEMSAYFLIVVIIYVGRYVLFPYVLNPTEKALKILSRITKIITWCIILLAVLIGWVFEFWPFRSSIDRYLFSPLTYSLAMTFFWGLVGFGGEIYVFVLAKYLCKMKSPAQSLSSSIAIDIKQRIEYRINEGVEEGFKLAICVTAISLIILYISSSIYRLAAKNIHAVVFALIVLISYGIPILSVYIFGQKEKRDGLKGIDEEINELLKEDLSKMDSERTQRMVHLIELYRYMRDELQNISRFQQRALIIIRPILLLVPILQDVVKEYVKNLVGLS